MFGSLNKVLPNITKNITLIATEYNLKKSSLFVKKQITPTVRSSAELAKGFMSNFFSLLLFPVTLKKSVNPKIIIQSDIIRVGSLNTTKDKKNKNRVKYTQNYAKYFKKVFHLFCPVLLSSKLYIFILSFSLEQTV